MLQLHTFTVPANGYVTPPFDADYIRIKSALVPFRFQTDNRDDFILQEGEEADLARFQLLKIINLDGADQSISIYVGNDGAKVGSAKVSGNITVANFPAVQDVEVTNFPAFPDDFITFGASWVNNAALGANTAATVFTAAANTNGAIVYAARFAENPGAAVGFLTNAFLAKATAPANATDGIPVLTTNALGGANSHTFGGFLERPIFIPAGLGLHYITTVAMSSGYSFRSVLYTLLP